jgi:hypothetical protein
MLCPKCSHEVDDGVKFCNECGCSIADYELLDKIKKTTLLLNENKLQEADGMLFDMEQKHPNNPDVLANIGRLHLKHNNKKIAKQYFIKALTLNSKHEIAKRYLRKINRFVIFSVAASAVVISIYFTFTSNINFTKPSKSIAAAVEPNKVEVSPNPTLSDQNKQTKNDDKQNVDPFSKESIEKAIQKIGDFSDIDVTMVDHPKVILKSIFYSAMVTSKTYTKIFDSAGMTNIRIYYPRTYNDGKEVFGMLIPNESNITWTKESNYESDLKGNIYVKDQAGNETIIIPDTIQVGTKWEEDLNGGNGDLEKDFHEIIGFADVKTLKNAYKNCLAIKTTRIHSKDSDLNAIEMNFYAQVIGLVKTSFTMKHDTKSMFTLKQVVPADITTLNNELQKNILGIK